MFPRYQIYNCQCWEMCTRRCTEYQGLNFQNHILMYSVCSPSGRNSPVTAEMTGCTLLLGHICLYLQNAIRLICENTENFVFGQINNGLSKLINQRFEFLLDFFQFPVFFQFFLFFLEMMFLLLLLLLNFTCLACLMQPDLSQHYIDSPTGMYL